MLSSFFSEVFCFCLIEVNTGYVSVVAEARKGDMSMPIPSAPPEDVAKERHGFIGSA